MEDEETEKVKGMVAPKPSFVPRKMQMGGESSSSKQGDRTATSPAAVASTAGSQAVGVPGAKKAEVVYTPASDALLEVRVCFCACVVYGCGGDCWCSTYIFLCRTADWLLREIVLLRWTVFLVRLFCRCHFCSCCCCFRGCFQPYRVTRVVFGVLLGVREAGRKRGGVAIRSIRNRSVVSACCCCLWPFETTKYTINKRSVSSNCCCRCRMRKSPRGWC